MPLYHSIVTTTARLPSRDLTALFRQLAKVVNANGGIFRSCENYGLKPLPHRIRSPHVSAGVENRYHYVGRMVGMYYDCSAGVLPMMEHIMRLNEGVLRYTILRPKTKMDKVNSAKKGNPWQLSEDRPVSSPVK